MPATVRSYILYNHVIAAFGINAVISGLLTWAVFRNATTVGLMGSDGALPDLLAMSFWMPLGMCLGLTQAVRAHIRKGRVSPFAVVPRSLLTAHPLPPTWMRALMLGISGVVLVAVPTMAALQSLGLWPMTFAGFMTFKCVYGAILGALTQPVIAIWALSEQAGEAAKVAVRS